MNHILIKKIDKLLLRTFVTTFILLLALVLFVMVIQTFFTVFNDVAGKGLGVDIYAKLLFYLSLNVFPNVFPIAILITCLIVFGNFSESFELTAMRSVGFSLQRTLRFPFIFTLFLSGTLLYFQDYIHPNSKQKVFSLVGDIVTKKSALFIQEGVICNNIPGYSIRVDKKLSNNEHMEGIIVYDYTKKYGTVSITTAQKGRFYTTPNEGYLVMELTNGHNYVEPLPDNNNHAKPDQKPSFYRNSFSMQKIRISLDALKLGKTNEQFAHDPRTRTRPRLKEMIQARWQKIVNQDKKSKDLLAEETIHYHATEPPTAQLDDHNIEQLAPPIQDTTEDSDFILFKNQFIEKRVDARVESHSQDGRHTLAKRVIRDALRHVKKIKNALITQKKHKALFYADLNRALYEKEHRLAVAIRCVIMFLLAAPLGCIIRRGGFGVSVCISFFFIIVEHVLSLLGEDLAIVHTTYTFIGAWLSNCILFPFCCFFLIKAQQGRGLSVTNWRVFYLQLKKIIKPKLDTSGKI